jgi:hypothetical protein
VLRSDEPRAQEEWLPKGFFSRDGGIWFQSGEPKAKPGFVCGMFTPVADTSDEHGKGHGTLLQWTLDSGRVQRWPVPSRMLHDSGNRSRPNSRMQACGAVPGQRHMIG